MLGCFSVTETFLAEERQFPCVTCGEVFRSKVALRRHETYVCNNTHAIFSQLNRDFRESQHHHHHNQQHTTAAAAAPAFQHPPAEATPEKSASSSVQSGEMIQESRPSAENSRDSSVNDEDERSEVGSIITGPGNIRQFPCENCEKVFSDPSNLQRHIRSSHVGARCHACHECGKTFATSSGLKQHQHIHSSVKPFQCEVCLKAYTQFSNLCRHKRMHADCRQQIKCKDCGQAFSTMTSLSKHKRFCEGMLRNGARFPFTSGGSAGGHVTGGPQSPEKPQPINPVASQASALTAAYMNFYGPRPPFPFYPPLGASFPMFPPGHPLAAMTPPMMPDAKFHPSTTPSSTSPRGELSPRGNPSPSPTPKVGEKRRLHADGSEGSDISEISTPRSASVASDVDMGDVSDGESDSGYERSSQPLKPSPGSLSHHASPRLHSPRACSPAKTSTPIYDLKRARRDREEALARHHHHKQRAEQPFDLSKSSSSSTGSSSIVSAGGGDQPLDLSVSKKARTESPVPHSTPRKTHIFGGGERAPGGRRHHHHHHHGERGAPTVKKTPLPSPPSPPAPELESPEQKSPLHYAYPMANPLLMEQMYRMDKDKLRTFQEAARMMAMGPARFPMPGPPYAAMAGMPGMLRTPMGLDPTKAMMNPLLKLDRAPEYPYGGQKVKDRYSCKFCGKIFPRSANLTRHLRTHTGEQPYKCKYCERSFSISSNLQRHVRNIHNKEKPFKCPLCDRCFGQQTNLDRHLKKHETDGPNVLDSPPPPEHQEADLDDKDESYFDEIRNFIGKATKTGAGDAAGEEEAPPAGSPREASSPAKPESFSHIDANFSITAQIEKHNQMSGNAEKAAEKYAGRYDDGNHSDGAEDADNVDVDIDAAAGDKEKVDNNNSNGGDMVDLPNGYHSNDEDVISKHRPLSLAIPT